MKKLLLFLLMSVPLTYAFKDYVDLEEALMLAGFKDLIAANEMPNGRNKLLDALVLARRFAEEDDIAYTTVAVVDHLFKNLRIKPATEKELAKRKQALYELLFKGNQDVLHEIKDIYVLREELACAVGE